MPVIDLCPVLEVQRRLYDIPRGPARFRAYLDALKGGTDDIVLPLSGFNPMGRDHVRATLDALIDLGAEREALAAIAEARARLAGVAGRFSVALVVFDDLGGGWTSRPLAELENRTRPGAMLRRGWAVAPIWTSEEPDPAAIRREVLATVYRALASGRFGEPRTLGAILDREGRAGRFAGDPGPGLDAEEVAYSREVIHPHRGAADGATILPCLYGDRMARAVGNGPMGLSDRAGFAVALDDARGSGVAPEDALRSTAGVA